MRINAEKLKALMSERELSAEDLSGAIAGQGASEKQRKLAEKKLRNWVTGRNHPRAKANEIQAIASALGVRSGAFVRWTSTYKWARGSRQKSGLVIDQIRGLGIEEATNLLEFSPRRASVMVGKALRAAIADAEAADADLNSLVVTEARADNGVIIKRFQPKDRGRAHPIQKRTSHIMVSVEEAN